MAVPAFPREVTPVEEDTVSSQAVPRRGSGADTADDPMVEVMGKVENSWTPSRVISAWFGIMNGVPRVNTCREDEYTTDSMRKSYQRMESVSVNVIGNATEDNSVEQEDDAYLFAEDWLDVADALSA